MPKFSLLCFGEPVRHQLQQPWGIYRTQLSWTRSSEFVCVHVCVSVLFIQLLVLFKQLQIKQWSARIKKWKSTAQCFYLETSPFRSHYQNISFVLAVGAFKQHPINHRSNDKEPEVLTSSVPLFKSEYISQKSSITFWTMTTPSAGDGPALLSPELDGMWGIWRAAEPLNSLKAHAMLSWLLY